MTPSDLFDQASEIFKENTKLKEINKHLEGRLDHYMRLWLNSHKPGEAFENFFFRYVLGITAGFLLGLLFVSVIN